MLEKKRPSVVDAKTTQMQQSTSLKFCKLSLEACRSIR